MIENKDWGGNPPLVPVILAGGGGKRLFPISTEENPKYLLKIGSDKTLIEETVNRAETIFETLKIGPSIIFIVCNQKHSRKIREVIRGSKKRYHLIPEPQAKNTAPAICLAAFEVKKSFGEQAVLLIMPSDHKIQKIDKFIEAVKNGYDLARNGYIVTFGVIPTYPETGYGYIEVLDKISEKAFKVKRFTEKPTQEKAKIFIESKSFFWNSGIFMSRVDTIIDELKKYTDIPSIILAHNLKKAYELLPNISIDYAVCEKSDKMVCIPAEFSWSDIGSYSSVRQFLDVDINGNAGDAYFLESKGCLYITNDQRSKKKTIFFGLSNIAVSEGKDFILVLTLDKDQQVKDVVDRISELVEQSRTKSK